MILMAFVGSNEPEYAAKNPGNKFSKDIYNGGDFI